MHFSCEDRTSDQVAPIYPVISTSQGDVSVDEGLFASRRDISLAGYELDRLFHQPVAVDMGRLVVEGYLGE